MTLTEEVEKNITIVDMDVERTYLLRNLFDDSTRMVTRIIDNTLINNAEVVFDTGKKIIRNIKRSIIR